MPFSPQVLNEIARLMRDPDSMRDEWERITRGRRGHYDPNQPRVPAGNPGGGRWIDTESTGAETDGSDGEQVRLAQFPLDPPPVRPSYPPVQPGYPPVQPGHPPVRPGFPPIRPGYPLVTLLTLFAAPYR